MQNAPYEGKHVKIIPVEGGYPDVAMDVIINNYARRTGHIDMYNGVHSKCTAYSVGSNIGIGEICYNVKLDGTDEIIIVPDVALELASEQ